MSISIQEKIRRKEAVDFAFINSRLEGLAHEDPAMSALYNDYINGLFDEAELIEKTKQIMEARNITSVAR